MKVKEESEKVGFKLNIHCSDGNTPQINLIQHIPIRTPVDILVEFDKLTLKFI